MWHPHFCNNQDIRTRDGIWKSHRATEELDSRTLTKHLKSKRVEGTKMVTLSGWGKEVEAGIIIAKEG